MENKISIRNAKFAKIGLQDMIDYIDLPTKSIVLEIGCYVGDSTEIFAKNFDIVHCVDPWVNGYDDKDPASYQHDMSIIEKQFDETASKYDNIKKHKMTSRNFNYICEKKLEKLFADIPHGENIEFKTKSGNTITVNVEIDSTLYDMIYIDGEHTYEAVKNDIEMWKFFVKPGGWLCGHDYQGKFPGTIKAVDEFQKPEKIFRDTSWCIRIK